MQNYIFFSMLLLSACAFAASKEDVQPMRLTVKAANGSFSVVEPVKLEVCMENAGDKDISITLVHPIRMYTMAITGPDGNAVSLTAEGKRLYDVAGSSSRATAVLRPKERRMVSFENLDRYYDMTVAGKYTILAKTLVGGKDGKFEEIASEQVVITLTEPSGYVGFKN